MNFSLHQTFCHMESAAHVWTLIARFSHADAGNWMEDSGDWWYDNNGTVGEIDPSSNTDMISPAFWLIHGNEFKITRSDDPQHTALLQTTGDCLDGQTFRSKITSYGDFRNGTTWGNSYNNRCLGNCTVQYGGQYETTKGFIRAKCNGTILSANRIGFWCDRGTWDGSVMMIGGSGTGVCHRTFHGIGVTAAKIPSFFAESGRAEADFGDSPYSGNVTNKYSLNLWIR